MDAVAGGVDESMDAPKAGGHAAAGMLAGLDLASAQPQAQPRMPAPSDAWLSTLTSFGMDDRVVYHGTLHKQKKTPGFLNKIPRWGERQASIKERHQVLSSAEAEKAGYPISARIYYLTWTSETDPTGERNVIEFRRVAEVKLKQISGGYQFKITMIPNESGETKEYWFKSVGEKAGEWVRWIGWAVGQTRYNQLPDPTAPTPAIRRDLSNAGIPPGQMIALTQYNGGTGLWDDLLGAPMPLPQGGQGGGRRQKKRTKRKTKKRKPRTKRRTKKRKPRTKRGLK